MAKQVTDRQGAVVFVASAADTHAARLQEKFAATFAEHLKPGEVMPEVGLVALLVARRLRAANATLVEKSDAYDKELSDDAGPRERRDEAAAKLTNEVVEIRSTLEAAFGAGILRELGLDGKTEVEPKAILAKAKRLVDELSRPAASWPKPRRKGLALDPSQWVADLTGPIATLEQSLADVAREAREAQAASDGKAVAMDRNDDVFSRSAGSLSGLLRLVEEDTLARQVRPSGRRPGRVAEPEEATSGEEGSTEGQGG